MYRAHARTAPGPGAPSHGHLSQLRSWRQQRALPESTHWLFVAVACHALEKVANTQGTYHDFPRDVWDSRAFKPLTLAPPPLSALLQEDTFESGSLTITEVPRKNYASYGGYRAREVHELLLLADKKPVGQGPRRGTSVPAAQPVVS